MTRAEPRSGFGTTGLRKRIDPLGRHALPLIERDDVEAAWQGRR